MHQQLNGRPPLAPRSQMQQAGPAAGGRSMQQQMMMPAGQQQGMRSISPGQHYPLGTYSALPAVLTSGLGTGTGTGSGAMQGLKDHADRLFQQQKTDKETSEKQAALLKSKDFDIRQLTAQLSEKVALNTSLTVQVQQGQLQAAEIQKKMADLATMHATLLDGVQSISGQLGTSKEEAEWLNNAAQRYTEALEELDGKYEALIQDKLRLQGHFISVERQNGLLTTDVAVADERCKALLAELNGTREDATSLKQDLHTLRERCATLEQALTEARATTAHQAAQLVEMAAARKDMTETLGAQLAFAREAAESSQAEVTNLKLLLQQREAELAHAGGLAAKLPGAEASLTKLHEQAVHEQQASAKLTVELATAKGELEVQLKKLSQAQAQGVKLQDDVKEDQRQLALQTAAQLALQEKLALTEARHMEALQAAVTSLEAEQADKTSKLAIYDEHTKALASELAAQGNSTATEIKKLTTEHEKVLAELKLAQDLAESRAGGLLAAQQAAQAAGAAHLKELETVQSNGAMSKQQVTARVHKAVEENSVKAQKALEDARKKAAVDVKKATDESKKLLQNVAELEKSMAGVQAALKAEQTRAAETAKTAADLMKTTLKEADRALSAAHKREKSLVSEAVAKAEVAVHQALEARQTELETAAKATAATALNDREALQNAHKAELATATANAAAELERAVDAEKLAAKTKMEAAEIAAQAAKDKATTMMADQLKAQATNKTTDQAHNAELARKLEAQVLEYAAVQARNSELARKLEAQAAATATVDARNAELACKLETHTTDAQAMQSRNAELAQQVDGLTKSLEGSRQLAADLKLHQEALQQKLQKRPSSAMRTATDDHTVSPADDLGQDVQQEAKLAPQSVEGNKDDKNLPAQVAKQGDKAKRARRGIAAAQGGKKAPAPAKADGEDHKSTAAGAPATKAALETPHKNLEQDKNGLAATPASQGAKGGWGGLFSGFTPLAKVYEDHNKRQKVEELPVAAAPAPAVALPRNPMTSVAAAPLAGGRSGRSLFGGRSGLAARPAPSGLTAARLPGPSVLTGVGAEEESMTQDTTGAIRNGGISRGAGRSGAASLLPSHHSKSGGARLGGKGRLNRMGATQGDVGVANMFDS